MWYRREESKNILGIFNFKEFDILSINNFEKYLCNHFSNKWFDTFIVELCFWNWSPVFVIFQLIIVHVRQNIDLKGLLKFIFLRWAIRLLVLLQQLKKRSSNISWFEDFFVRIVSFYSLTLQISRFLILQDSLNFSGFCTHTPQTFIASSSSS